MATPTQADDRIIESSMPGRRMPARVLFVVLLGCAVAASLGSRPLLGAANALPDGPVATALRGTASDWNRLMENIGAPLTYDVIRAAARGFEAWHAPS